MCNLSGSLFIATKLDKNEVLGKSILEVGAYQVNGSLRTLIESWKPAEYIGVDIQKGTGVDLVYDAEKLLDIFPEERFDIVLSTELLEHVVHPKTVISNMKRLCKRGGHILLTTRSRGFPFHPHPYDFWRFEPSDMQHLFSDCEITDLEQDFESPGAFIKVRKPCDFKERDFPELELYNITVKKRATSANWSDVALKIRLGLFAYNVIRSTVNRCMDAAGNKAVAAFKFTRWK